VPEPPSSRTRPLRALIDTNVLVQRRWLAPTIAAARDGLVQPLWSPLIIAEANRYLTWRWLQRHRGVLDAHHWNACSADAKKWFSITSAAFRVVEDCPPHERLWTPEPPDAWDIPLWTAAVRGDADVVVTENLQDGPPPDVHGLRSHAGVLLLDPDAFFQVLERWTDLLEGSMLPALPESMGVGGFPAVAPERTESDDPPLLSSAIELLRNRLLEHEFEAGEKH